MSVIPLQPPVDNDHVAPGCEPFTHCQQVKPAPVVRGINFGKRARYGKLEARVVNMDVDDVIRLNRIDAPCDRWFYALSKRWRKKGMPTLSLSVWIDGEDIVILRTK